MRTARAKRKPIPTVKQALERIETRRAQALLRHQMEAADRRSNARADQRVIERMIYGRLSPGVRESLKLRHAALQREIAANLY